MSSAKEREFLVKRIVELTGAEIFEAIVKESGRDGCRLSHEAIYKGIPEGEDLLLFEDDCVVNDESFLDFVKNNKKKYDIIYIGVNHVHLDENKKPYKSFGTHSMWISYKAIQAYFKYSTDCKEVDNIWCAVEHAYKLKVLRANPIDKYTTQHEGFISYITGQTRRKTTSEKW